MPIEDVFKEVVDAAEFLQYRASEGEILFRILINIPPDILAQAAFYQSQGHIESWRTWQAW